MRIVSKDVISVPRELLERATKDYTGRPMWDALENDRLASVEELRALLSQPNTCTKDGGQCGLGGYCEPCHSVEPVGYAQTSDLSRLRTVPRVISAGVLVRVSPEDGYEPLYRRPPAQAPVVLPERKQVPGNGVWHFLQPDYLSWNACLDEFKRLNPTL